MARLAKVHGGDLPKLNFGRFSTRSLFELAKDNAVSGCIFETYSAFKAIEQSQKASDPVLRETMKKIAIDESKHAELAWDIHRYLWQKLSISEQAEIEQAQKEALKSLLTPSTFHLSHKERILLGLNKNTASLFFANWHSIHNQKMSA